MMEQRHCKVLVVDDEPEVEPMFRQRLRREIRGGVYELVFARTGLEALQVLEASPDIDMVVTDINMPEMDGLELLLHLNERKPELRSVILSAYGDMENIRKAMNRGAFDFITKPVDFNDLKVTIERAMEQMERWREATSSRDQLLELQKELALASQMQQMIVPDEFPRNRRVAVAGRMRAARNVGGDFYDVCWLDEKRLALVVADVAGKGVPAALLMMSTRTLLQGVSASIMDPGEVLNVVNGMLCDSNRFNMFVTVFYGVYDVESGLLRYASAGHDPPLLVRPEGAECMPLTGGVVLGVLPDFEYAAGEVSLKVGDEVMMYTDGVTEAEDDAGAPFGRRQLAGVLESGVDRDVDETIAAVFEAVDGFTGDRPQFDDITCLLLKRQG